ncbi:tRNA (adenosine(37)-N6)-threonylcarbamoyltransferase complex dimerization subunit type 1 TsaB [Candidatus Palibaumannia cicadellinicola]|uniref:tRNA threonylcarbamoyladenosine biosynthesis protein TsaB n=1 Tax=Candidatus Palibaumannia cicadellinicola TaxID=186490 RepID=A0A088NB80_9GAMM|nr:tRNA (adenosine(37)-N6)-threonylcarbamoyltransferase complex dimerization subunit type 1 TsaB [Candidatus Baumannia cicadellinicola]AIN47368.1 metal-dependent protease-like protein, putative molecular chaperone [Candidatus Baumannia cicadellinicola]
MSTSILAIETATEACSAALMIDNTISERFAVTPREHTQHILLMVDSLLAEASITLSDLDTIAFSRGPGSFTGVRISISIAQGLALGANLSLIGISTLVTLAQGAWRQTGAHQVLTAIDARMGEIYCAPYRRNNKGVWLGEADEAVRKPEELVRLTSELTGEWFCAGTGWMISPVLIAFRRRTIKDGQNVILPSAQDILPLALQQWRTGCAQSVDKVEPVYLRNKVAFQTNR